MVTVRVIVLLVVGWLLTVSSAAAGDDSAVTTIAPEGGTIRLERERLEIFDRKSRRVGYSVRRGDGSWEVFNLDGTRRATIQRGVGEQSRRIIVPRR